VLIVVLMCSSKSFIYFCDAYGRMLFGTRSKPRGNMPLDRIRGTAVMIHAILGFLKHRFTNPTEIPKNRPLLISFY
jgi:hypothetical protein